VRAKMPVSRRESRLQPDYAREGWQAAVGPLPANARSQSQGAVCAADRVVSRAAAPSAKGFVPSAAVSVVRVRGVRGCAWSAAGCACRGCVLSAAGSCRPLQGCVVRVRVVGWPSVSRKVRVVTVRVFSLGPARGQDRSSSAGVVVVVSSCRVRVMTLADGCRLLLGAARHFRTDVDLTMRQAESNMQARS
jgi:hypothetical protein